MAGPVLIVLALLALPVLMLMAGAAVSELPLHALVEIEAWAHTGR